MIDFNQQYNVHFIGIGGVSIHSLALFCKDCGWKVVGSDASTNKYTRLCQERGIKVFLGHKKEHIKSPDFVVKSSAIKDDNPELAYAKDLGIKVYDRAEFLNAILKKIPTVIAVSGTHGKSTTSTMIYEILKNAHKRVSCQIGADVDNANLSLNDEILVLEACEYNKNFLKFKIDIAVVLNVEKDHMECYGSFFQLKNAFLSFLKHAKKRYVFVSPTTDYITLKNLTKIEQPKIIKNKFLFEKHKYMLDFLIGEQYIFDACVAIKVATDLGVPYKIIYETLKNFRPINRRQQLIGKINNHSKSVDNKCANSQTIDENSNEATLGKDLSNKSTSKNIIQHDTEIYIDYAHHPTEIKCNLDAFSHYKTLCIFQPHTFSRTKFLKKEFVSVLSKCDCIIYKEYSARETAKDGLSAYDLYTEILKCKKTSAPCNTIDKTKNEINKQSNSRKESSNQNKNSKRCTENINQQSLSKSQYDYFIKYGKDTIQKKQFTNINPKNYLIKYADNVDQLKQMIQTSNYEKIIFFGAGNIDQIAYTICHDLIED